MASTIVVPTAANIGGFSTEIATNAATRGDYDTRVANELIAVATAAVVDIDAIQANVATLQAQDSTGTYTALSGDAVGDVVYISAANTVALADANDAAKRPAIGIIIAKPTTTSATVQFVGEVTGLAGLTAGAAYYLSETAGDLTATPPAGNVQLIGYAKSTTILHLFPSTEAFVLSSTTAGLGASMIGVEDAATNFAATNVETALAEIVSDLAATTATNGASRIGIEDVAANFTATTVEGALAEVYSDLASNATGLGASLIGVDATNDTLEVALAAVKATADAAIGIVRRSVQITNAGDLDALGGGVTVFTKNLGAALPANANIIAAQVKLTTPLTGGGMASVALDIGTAADIDAIVDGADVLAAAVDGQSSSTRPAGIAPNKHFVAGAAQLIVTLTGNADLNLLTAGDVTIDVLYSVLA